MLRRSSTRHHCHGFGFESLEARELLTVNMSPREQLFIELVNRARADPLAEVARNREVAELNQDVAEDRLISTDPKQPLAPHQALTDAMIGHVLDMLRRNFFGHDNPDGVTPSERAIAAGYPRGAGENIAWSGNTGIINEVQEVYLRHDGLFESVGHRVNMMSENWREIGAGIRYGSYTNDVDSVVYRSSIMAGTLFGNRGGNNFITGVAITDGVSANNFYEIGEGLGDVLVNAVNTTTKEVYSIRTGVSGGYSLQVPDGVYELTATGQRITRPLKVQGVTVAGKNVKVDFNTRTMNTRSVEGRVFDDTNRNSLFDSGERQLAGRIVFLDNNDNNVMEENEIRVETDVSGRFRIGDLLPGEYIVRQVVSEGWEQPTEGAFYVDTSHRNLTGLNFPVNEANESPIASNDRASVKLGEEIRIAVLSNDSDPEGDTLISSSIRLHTQPQFGQATINGDRVLYQAGNQYVGADQFSYSVDDANGQTSNVATVTVTIESDFPWQNPVEPLDINNSGHISPADVLTLVNEIDRIGPHSLAERPRQTNSDYYDVSGDNFLTAIDVLFVVTHLNDVNGRGNAEPPNLVHELPVNISPKSTDHLFAMLVAATDEDKP